MKILMEHLQHFKEKINKLFEDNFKINFINLLLDNSSQLRDSKSSMKWDWYEQKLYAIKRLATETRTTLSMRVKKEDKIKDDVEKSSTKDKKEDTKEATEVDILPTETSVKGEEGSIAQTDTTKEETKDNPSTENESKNPAHEENKENENKENEQKKTDENKEELNIDSKDKKEEEEEEGDIDSKLTKLHNDMFVKSKLHRLSLTESDNAEDNKKKKAQRELFQKAYVISEEEIYDNYLKTLEGFYYQLSRKTLTSFIECSPVEEILEIVMKDEETLLKFIKYIQIRGNETIRIKQSSKDHSHYVEFMNVLKKFVEVSAKDKKYHPVIDMLFNKLIIEGALNTIKRAKSCKSKLTITNVFNEEGIDLEALNSEILPELVNVILKQTPELLFQKDSFTRVVSVLLMLPMIFENDKDFQSE